MKTTKEDRQLIDDCIELLPPGVVNVLADHDEAVRLLGTIFRVMQESKGPSGYHTHGGLMKWKELAITGDIEAFLTDPEPEKE